MGADPTERWRRPIATEDLTPELLPEPGAPWSQLVYFAGTLDGYEAVGGGVTELMEFARPIQAEFRERGELPADIGALRIALFAEQRRDHFSASASQPETMHYVHALVEAMRAQLAG